MNLGKSILWMLDVQKINYPLNQLKNNIIKICGDRWSEGIYDIPLASITSEEILLNQSDIPELVNPADYNDLETAWTKARMAINEIYSENNQILRDIGYEIIVELMHPNLIYDKETTERTKRS